ncbi:hypothetical protein LI90_2780 [Carbonactinospora thermoautotrophica]|uniref:Resolvase/invertase-type recombinase catalytic domain-containing protein n=1 Tax=Carbonactinospora thermoautotrophica TaxID=1469144 RepID=A0A132MV07_9ACTN|nr:recombinase family protein [Carbonactinospora thermoautotrophica]KWX01748.1 hypothetical protein LI90_2780 [Carbonactinospora thermoautotrophica]
MTRATLAGWALKWTTDVIALVASELVTNAVKPAPGALLTLALRREPDRVREVHDRCAEPPQACSAGDLDEVVRGLRVGVALHPGAAGRTQLGGVMNAPTSLVELAVPAVPAPEPAAGTAVHPVASERASRVRPLIVGYLRVSTHTTAEQADRMRREIAEFADREGFTLLEIFMEMETTATSAFAALVDALQCTEARTVVVPAMHHLGRLPGVRLALKELLERQIGAQVLVMHPNPEEGA